MNRSNSYKADTTAPDKRSGISIKNGVAVSMAAIIAVIAIVMVILVGVGFRHTVSLGLKAYEERELQAMAGNVETAIELRAKALAGQAKNQIIIQAVMQPEYSRGIIADHLSGLRILGHSYPLVLLDYQGEVVYHVQTKEVLELTLAPRKCQVDDIGVNMIDIVEGADKVFWRIIVPVLYNGLPEGALVMLVPLSEIFEHLELSAGQDQTEMRLLHDGRVVETRGESIDAEWLSVPLSNTDAILQIRNSKEKLISAYYSTASVLFGVMAFFIVTTWWIISRFAQKHLVIPITQLERSMVRVSENTHVGTEVLHSQRIAELHSMGMVFNNMIAQVQERDRKLRATHDQLELKVQQRTNDLDKEKKQTELMLKGIGDGVVVTDATHRIILHNHTALEMLELKDPIEFGDHLALLLENTSLNGQKLKSFFELDSFKGMSFQVVHPVTRWLKVNCNTYMDEDGKSAGRILILHDITQEKEIEQMKSDFVSSVSHEFRTPLTSIKGYALTILRDDKMPLETQRNFLEVINEESDRLTRLVEDLLEISRIESGKRELKRQLVNLQNILESAITKLNRNTLEKNLEILMHTSGKIPEVNGDQDKLFIVVYNLLSNAIKFTPEKGTIIVNLREEESFVEIQISDTGVGIPKRDLDRIFERFFRVNRPGSQIPGTGLGLAIVKDIVTLHGGTIDVKSKMGHGTTFSLKVPYTNVGQTGKIVVKPTQGVKLE